MNAADRLSQAIKASAMDITTLARKLKEKGATGGSRAQLHRYLSGEAKADPPIGVLSEAAEILGVSKMWLAFGAEPVRWVTESEGWSAKVALEVAEATPYFANDPTLRTLLFDLLIRIGSSIDDDNRFMRADVVRWAKLVQSIATYTVGTLDELHGDDSDAKEKARRQFLIAMLGALPHLIPPKAAATWDEPELMRLLDG